MKTKTNIVCPHCGEGISILADGEINEISPIFIEVDTPEGKQLAFDMGVVLADTSEQ